MVFNWRDYYTLAQALAKYENYEAVLRSVVSRAYYAAFCIARNKALAQGLEIRKDESVHKQVIQYYRRNPNTSKMGKELDELRDDRVKCDYYNKVSQPIKLAILSLKRSKRILDFFP